MFNAIISLATDEGIIQAKQQVEGEKPGAEEIAAIAEEFLEKYPNATGLAIYLTRELPDEAA